VLCEHAPDEARRQLVEPVVEHPERSNLEIEEEQVAPTAAAHQARHRLGLLSPP
jgi:hypothetical protein